MTTTNRQQVETWHAEYLAARDGHWGDRMCWITADEIARRLDLAQAPEPRSCELPPDGWYCTRQAGHEGPCAAYPGP